MTHEEKMELIEKLIKDENNKYLQARFREIKFDMNREHLFRFDGYPDLSALAEKPRA